MAGLPEKLRQYLEFDLYWQGAAQAAEKLGYRLEEFIVPDDFSLKKLERIFRARNICGVFLPPQPLSAIDWGTIHWDSLHTVRFGYGNHQLPDFHMVTSDQNANASLAFSEIQRKGYRRIGFVGNNSSRRLFLSGFLQAQVSLPVEERLAPLLFDTPQPKVAELAAWFDRERPEAILSDATDLADSLSQIGRKIPEDVAVATFSTLDGHVNAGIYQNSREIGRIAVFLLHSLILDNARGIPTLPRKVAIPGTWLDGSSLPDRRRHSPGLEQEPL
ncbi:MAG: substrate-binding domain-containing protein [Chthoniobacteraceae bacterium]